MASNHGERRLGELIAHWNLEHSPDERQAHLDWARRFLKESGLDRFLTARLRKPSVCWCLGYPKTCLDLTLRKRYRNRVYRHQATGARIAGLSVFHVVFARQAGVYDYERHANEVGGAKDCCRNAGDAARITAAVKWDGEVCEYTLRTDGRHYGYRCRTCSGYDGSSGDSFKYGPDWDDIHKRLGDVLYRIVGDFGLRQIKD